MVHFLKRSEKCPEEATFCVECSHHFQSEGYDRCRKDPTYHCDYVTGNHRITYGGCEWKNYGRCEDFTPLSPEQADNANL